MKNLEGNVYVFTGVRDKNAEFEIEKLGGRVSSAVSGKTTHLVMKEKNSGSAKEQKALDLGIEIITIDELREFLGL